ncbi:MAG: hypothetical protein JNJ40_16095 [Bacteroidia bacterium]|nr:hypothetical protein [Bacteroidia bacterium]
MKIIRSILVLATALFFIQSCGYKNTASKPCHASWEFQGGKTTDTLNRTDCDGLKQGKWVPNKSNNLIATTYYRNDTLISSQ